MVILVKLYRYCPNPILTDSSEICAALGVILKTKIEKQNFTLVSSIAQKLLRILSSESSGGTNKAENKSKCHWQVFPIGSKSRSRISLNMCLKCFILMLRRLGLASLLLRGVSACLGDWGLFNRIKTYLFNLNDYLVEIALPLRKADAEAGLSKLKAKFAMKYNNDYFALSLYPSVQNLYYK